MNKFAILDGIGSIVYQILGTALVALFIIIYARIRVWLNNRATEANNLRDDVIRDDIFRELISELRVKTNADRAMVFQFHNGPKFLTGLSFKKISLTYISRKTFITNLYPAESYQEVAMVLLIPFIKDLLEEEYIVITNQNIPEKYENVVYITNADSKLNIHTKIIYKDKFVGFISLSFTDSTATFDLAKVALLISTASDIATMLCQEDYLFIRRNRQDHLLSKFITKLKRIRL